MPTLTTSRLTLRAPTEADVDRMLTYRNAPEVTRWLLNTVVEPASFRSSWLSSDAPDDHSVVVDLDGSVIGTVSLEVSDGMGQPGMPTGTEASLGYTFDPSYGGQGYAFEAVSAMVDHAFGTLGVRRLTAGCFADNAASVRILEKLGMRREQYGVQDSWHAELGWIDGATYGMLAEEWRARSDASA